MVARARKEPNIFTRAAGGTVTAFRIVRETGGTVVLAGAGEDGAGVAQGSATIGQQVAVVSSGETLVEASEAINEGQQLSSGANGKARVAQDGDELVGIALANASGDGVKFLMRIDLAGTLNASGGGGGGGDADTVAGTYSCLAGIAVGDVVAISGASNAVAADAVSASGAAIGVVKSKPAATSALVVYQGEVGAFAGLTPNALYWLASGGGLTLTPPTVSGSIQQVIGRAKSTSILVVEIEKPFLN